MINSWRGPTTGWLAGDGDDCSNDKDDNHHHDEEGNNTDLNVYDDYNYANDDSDDTHVHSYLCIEQCPLEDKMLPSAKCWLLGFRQSYSEEIVVMWFLCQIYSEDVIMMRSLQRTTLFWGDRDDSSLLTHLFWWDDLFVKLAIEDGDVIFKCLWYPGGMSKGTPRLPRKITCGRFIFWLHFGAKSSCFKKKQPKMSEAWSTWSKQHRKLPK